MAEVMKPTNGNISNILSAVDNLVETLVSDEPCVMRRSEVVTAIEKAVVFYKELYAFE